MYTIQRLIESYTLKVETSEDADIFTKKITAAYPTKHITFYKISSNEVIVQVWQEYTFDE